MRKSRVSGTESKKFAQADSNGFVNRRSTVQSCPPAPSSEKYVFTKESARAAVDGYLAGRDSAARATAALSWAFRNSAGAAVTASLAHGDQEAIGILVVEAKRRRAIAKRKQATAARQVRVLEQRMRAAS